MSSWTSGLATSVKVNATNLGNLFVFLKACVTPQPAANRTGTASRQGGRRHRRGRRGTGSGETTRLGVEFFLLWNPRNPLKSPESDEEIQENPSPFPWFGLVWLGPALVWLEGFGRPVAPVAPLRTFNDLAEVYLKGQNPRWQSVEKPERNRSRRLNQRWLPTNLESSRFRPRGRQRAGALSRRR